MPSIVRARASKSCTPMLSIPLAAALIKPRIGMMVVISTLLGYLLAGGSIWDWQLVIFTLVGTALSCSGASTLNNYLERDVDSLMRRTCGRPLPKGKVAPADALSFGIILVLSGVVMLAWLVNLLTGFLALLTCFLYVLVYTPLKRKTWLNTIIGAIPGAIPPLGGWAAATDSLGMGVWILFLIMFLWQHPHFYAIAWMYREDYARGGFKMLPVVEPDGRSTFRQIVLFSVALILVSLLPALYGSQGLIYTLGALIGGGLTLYYGLILRKSASEFDARSLMRATLLYFPILLVCVILESAV
ncbi:MAG: heme o synthase [Oligoflexia bacterium]|nr:heme o synthase [Oligoflexia bacterium]